MSNPPKSSGQGKKAPISQSEKIFEIKHPIIWLMVAAFLVYAPTLTMGMTDLDDGIFINKNAAFNEDLRNLFYAFTRTIFNNNTDGLYRPVGTVIMILNYHLANHGTNIAIYHLVNIVIHLISVALLFQFLRKLNINVLYSFLLTLFFAVHPALTEAVAWICARVEPLLGLFALAFFNITISYVQSGKMSKLLYAALFLLLALFEKETAVVIAPVAFLLITLILGKKWNARENLIQFAVWFACYAIWFIARTNALSSHAAHAGAVTFGDIGVRSLTLVQYLGKLFFPVNLSVYPLQEDTVYYYGVVAIAFLAAALWFNKKKTTNFWLTGTLIFIMFLAPTLVIPKNINVQIFEYRAYLPAIGVLLVLSQILPLTATIPDKKVFTGGIAICGIFAAININYQQSFKDPLCFWTQAEASSPHSAYAKMMLAARTEDKLLGEKLFFDAYKINPNERMLNFIYGVFLTEKDSLLQSEKYFLQEKTNTGYYECDFYLARIAMAKNDRKAAISYLESYIKNDSKNKDANNNLLLLYLDTDQDEKAKKQAIYMKSVGIEVPAAILEHFHI